MPDASRLHRPCLETDRFQAAIEVRLRPAQLTDLSALEWMGMFARHRGTIATAFRSQECGDGLMLLAVAAGFPVGQAWIDFTASGTNGTARIWAVRTFPPLCGAGIGSRLLRAAEESIGGRGLRQAELLVEYENHRARRFYERLGWSVTGTATDIVHTERDDGSIMREQLTGWRMMKKLKPPLVAPVADGKERRPYRAAP